MAVEWLVVLGCFFVGMPIVFIFSNTRVRGEEVFAAFLATYVFVQFVRSVVWAVRTVRNPQ